jgi:hypothetical protein
MPRERARVVMRRTPQALAVAALSPLDFGGLPLPCAAFRAAQGRRGASTDGRLVNVLSSDARLRAFRILPLSAAQPIGTDGKLTRWNEQGDVQ